MNGMTASIIEKVAIDEELTEVLRQICGELKEIKVVLAKGKIKKPINEKLTSDPYRCHKCGSQNFRFTDTKVYSSCSYCHVECRDCFATWTLVVKDGRVVDVIEKAIPC